MREFYTECATYDSTFNLDSDINIYASHLGAGFRICYTPALLATSPSLLAEHRKSYQILYQEDDPDRFVEEVARLRERFNELMTELASTFLTSEYLHGYVYPPYFILEARVAEDGQLQPHFKEAITRQEFSRPGEYIMHVKDLQPLLASKLDVYSSRQIQILDRTRRNVPSRILADTNALSETRISRLRGLVIDNDEDVLQHYSFDPKSDEEDCVGTRLVGLLISYIENKGTLAEVAPWSDCANEDRLRWQRQIERSVEQLHRAGVVWGDAKPDNVLIDVKGDAWLIDFGGSYTPGWVDADKRETVEGDLQGLQRIHEWLAKWSREPIDCSKRVTALAGSVVV
ncbi:hypothetical protein N0V88_000729 [Collariella sp. IMI 366227]|nr:hypothetical protein N0V88_000729 [Collariella sp. IMI 366227]